jgi:6-phosphogluconolactonase
VINDLRVLADADALAHAVAAAVASVITRAIERRGRCALALSGGATPRGVYRVLSAEFRSVIAWPKLDVFWGDERFVPATSPESNYGMARAELLDRVPLPAANVHPIPTHLPAPEAAADAYAQTLRAYFGAGLPRFDLMLLGIGEDCHTASLFPHSPALSESDRVVVATPAPDGTGWRVSLTTAVLTAAETAFVLATGAKKAPAIRRALAPGTDIADCPAAALRHRTGTTIWWIDRAAASDRVRSAEGP